MDIVRQTLNVNTPSILGTDTALEANTARIGWRIQNCGTNILYVRLGTAASTTLFHFALSKCTANDDGLGASAVQLDGVVYTGVISVAGVAKRYVVIEH